MSSQELEKRVSAALDAPGGIEADAELKALVAADPELQSFIADAKKLDEVLRAWPLEEISDEAWEAMAERVDQRLDDALSAIGDVTRPPAFEDDDARRDPSGRTAVADPQKSSFTIERLSDLESTEELSIPHLPPPTPSASNVIPLTNAKPSRKDERLEIPTVKPLLQPLSPLGPISLPPPKKSRTGWIVAGGFAAAAAVLVVFGLQMTKREASDSVVATNQSGAPDYAPTDHGGGEYRARDNDDEVAREVAANAPTEESPARLRENLNQAATPTSTPRGPERDALGGLMDGADEERNANGESARIARMPTTEQPSTGAFELADRIDGDDSSGDARGGQFALARNEPGAPAAAAPPPAVAPRQQETVAARQATTPRATAATRTADDEGGAERATPEQGEVRSALESVRAAITACAAGQHGQANIRVTFSGASGRVSNVNVEGVFAGTPQGSCMARAVRAARVSRFSDPTLVVLYPYAL